MSILSMPLGRFGGEERRGGGCRSSSHQLAPKRFVAMALPKNDLPRSIVQQAEGEPTLTWTGEMSNGQLSRLERLDRNAGTATHCNNNVCSSSPAGLPWEVPETTCLFVCFNEAFFRWGLICLSFPLAPLNMPGQGIGVNVKTVKTGRINGIDTYRLNVSKPLKSFRTCIFQV